MHTLLKSEAGSFPEPAFPQGIDLELEDRRARGRLYPVTVVYALGFLVLLTLAYRSSQLADSLGFVALGGGAYTLLNNGNGTFTDVTAQAGLDKPDAEYGPLWSVGGVWLDVNNDGNLDLFVTNYLAWNPDQEPTCLVYGKRDYCHPRYYGKTPNRLYLGDGKGTFTDVSASSGIRAHPGKGMGAAMADFDGDGWMDIFVTNDKLANFLFHNLGGGKFREVAVEAGVAYPADGSDVSGMGSDFRDIDNDGRPDIVFVALPNETFPLYRNTGKGYFEDASASSQLERFSRAMGGYSPELYDFDNDGWKDLFVSRGHVQANTSARDVVNQHNSVFRNLGNGTFGAFTGEAGFATQPPRRHRGSAVGDLDGDGRPDVVVTALAEPAEVWMNVSPAKHHWLELKLVGTTSNRDGIGARIELTVAGGATLSFGHRSATTWRSRRSGRDARRARIR